MKTQYQIENLIDFVGDKKLQGVQKTQELGIITISFKKENTSATVGRFLLYAKEHVMRLSKNLLVSS